MQQNALKSNQYCLISGDARSGIIAGKTAGMTVITIENIFTIR
jgi:beta-phosphoglucomutase-like phosphatase (HAD superfamily)